jgi:hypothetical protein
MKQRHARARRLDEHAAGALVELSSPPSSPTHALRLAGFPGFF